MEICHNSSSLMPCPFTGRKTFCACRNFFCRTKNLFTLCASHKLLCQTKRWFAFSKIDICAGTKVFEEVKFLGWLKKFGLAKNILRPVKGQGIGYYAGSKGFYLLGITQPLEKPGNHFSCLAFFLKTSDKY